MKRNQITENNFICKHTCKALHYFDETTQQKLINLLYSKKKDSKQHEEMEYEIIVGSLLVQAGFNIEHEKAIDGKKPDWFVLNNDNHPEFIVEVAVLNSEEIVSKFEIQIRELKDKIRSLPFNAELRLDFHHLIEPHLVTPFINIDCVLKDISNWLSDNPSGTLQTNDVIIEYIGITENGISLQSDTGHGRSWRDDRFLAKLEEKRNTYMCEVVKNKLPYIIAVIATCNCGTTLERIFDILTGRNKTTVTHGVNGNSMPTVSGIIIIEPLSNWKTCYFDNSDAALFKLVNQIMVKVVELASEIKN